MLVPECPFCALPTGRILACSEYAVAIRDAYPVSPGHTLILPRRHIASFFEASADERADMLTVLHTAKQSIDIEHHPVTYNIGINDGPAAGQTIAHLHIHLIPRYLGDVHDPRGGVRWVLPERARYWEPDD